VPREAASRDTWNALFPVLYIDVSAAARQSAMLKRHGRNESMRRSLPLIAATLVIALASCTDDLLNGPGNSGGDFSISVGSGTTPTYSWSAGPAFSIDVVRTSNQTQVVWRITDPTDPRNIGSPVRHGIVPNGAIESSTLERVLTPGVTYRVSITLANQQSAFQDFTP
jgi:hypothetical protein